MNTETVTNSNILFTTLIGAECQNVIEGIDFYLTGSVYFGGTTPESDYDFMAQADFKVYEALEKLGFKEILWSDMTAENYSDPDLKFLFRKNQNGKQIDVQLSGCLPLRLKARNALMHDINTRELCLKDFKHTPVQFWISKIYALSDSIDIATNSLCADLCRTVFSGLILREKKQNEQNQTGFGKLLAKALKSGKK